MVDMLDSSDWQFWNNTATRWCRIIVENKMSACCTDAEFAKGIAGDCPDCIANCMHTQYIEFCNKHFGKACKVVRRPFHANGVMGLTVHESFCIPHACANSEDLERSAILKWFAWHYRMRRIHWHYDYDEAIVECPDSILLIVFSILAGFIVVLGSIPVGLFLFKAPKERGRTLISQADMQDSAQDSVPIGEDEDTLRSAAFGGGDTLGSTASFIG